jgi:recombination protein RecA
LILLYGEGISIEGELLALGEKMGIIKKAGASYSYIPDGDEKEEIKLGRGYDATRQFLKEKENKKIHDKLLKEVTNGLKAI